MTQSDLTLPDILQGTAGEYVADRQQTDVFEEVRSFNDNGRVMTGLHENFLGVHFNDPTLSKVSYASPRLCAYCFRMAASGPPWAARLLVIYCLHASMFCLEVSLVGEVLRSAVVRWTRIAWQPQYALGPRRVLWPI